MSDDAPVQARRQHWLRLSAVAAGMFGFGFALVPLYNAICELTGVNGRPSNTRIASTVVENPQARTVSVEFLTTVNGDRGYTFDPVTPRIEVHPGKLYKVEFVAQNTRDHAVVAQAVPSIAPFSAARHLRKTECFCFRQQPFAAGEEKRMPVVFMLDPELPAEVDTVTLSYTFFDAPQVASR